MKVTKTTTNTLAFSAPTTDAIPHKLIIKCVRALLKGSKIYDDFSGKSLAPISGQHWACVVPPYPVTHAYLQMGDDPTSNTIQPIHMSHTPSSSSPPMSSLASGRHAGSWWCSQAAAGDNPTPRKDRITHCPRTWQRRFNWNILA